MSNPWCSPTQAVAGWTDAETLPADVVELFLDVAYETCLEYAPALAAGAVPPKRYTLAVALQAADDYAATKRDAGDVIGVGEQAIRVRPITDQVRAKLRPRSAVPGFGGTA